MENPKPLCYEVNIFWLWLFYRYNLRLSTAFVCLQNHVSSKASENCIFFIIHFIGCVLITKILARCRSCRKWTDMNWKWCLKVSIDWYWFYRVGTTIHATFISRKIFTLIVMTDIFFQYFFRRWSNKMLTKYGVMMIFSI